MKKLFIAILGVAAFAACSQEMTLETPKGAAIAFDNAFVNNSTRAAIDLTKGNFDFGVYGTVANASGDALIFTNQTVASDGSYSPAQYWVANATYTFTAYAPKTGAQWTYAPATDTASEAYNGTLSFNNAAALGEQDLIFAAAEKTTPATIESAPEKVGLTFGHLLSKVAFKFTNIFTDKNISLNVYGVQINNAAAEGTLPVVDGATEDWTGTGDYVRAFGAAEASEAAALANGTSLTTEHYYLIPVEREYEITFNVGLYQAGVLLNTYEHKIYATLNLEKGKSYSLNATLAAENVNPESQLFPIEFKVDDVEDWTEGNVTIVAEHEVATAAELSAAVAEGGTILLTQDINLDEVSSRANAYAGLTIDNDVVIDGAGHKLTSSATRAINIVGGHTVTIMNAEVVAGNTSADYYRAINVEGANNNVTLENVTAYAYYYAVNLVSSVDNCVLNINNCNITGITAINVWGTNSVVTVNNSVLTCDQAPSNVENYAVIMVNSDNSTVTVNGGEIVADAGNLGGAVDADGSAIVFNGTNGNCTIENHPYVISYGDNKYSMATWEEAYETAKAGETIVVTQDVALSNPLLVSKNIAVDLNGHTLTAPVFAESNGAVLEGDSDSYVFWVKEGATLTINGEGTVAAQNAKYSIAVWAQGGNVVINGGTYTNAGEGADLIYASAGGNVVINGGEFVACPKQAGVDGTLNAYSALNVKDADYRSGASDIVVYGGKFFQFNPADNASEGAGTNFVAAGYKSVADGEWYNVVAE